jgi:hypothetical protein
MLTKSRQIAAACCFVLLGCAHETSNVSSSANAPASLLGGAAADVHTFALPQGRVTPARGVRIARGPLTLVSAEFATEPRPEGAILLWTTTDPTCPVSAGGSVIGEIINTRPWSGEARIGLGEYLCIAKLRTGLPGTLTWRASSAGSDRVAGG